LYKNRATHTTLGSAVFRFIPPKEFNRCSQESNHRAYRIELRPVLSVRPTLASVKRNLRMGEIVLLSEPRIIGGNHPHIHNTTDYFSCQ
jgi:hypothetical protein